MICMPGNHVCSWDGVSSDEAPPPGLTCICGRFVHRGQWVWEDTVEYHPVAWLPEWLPGAAPTGRCPRCTHPMDDHPGCCRCEMRVK